MNTMIARADGFAAYLDGCLAIDNPFVRIADRAMMAEWFIGWLEARDQEYAWRFCQPDEIEKEKLS